MMAVESTTCSSCLKLYTDPRVLPCLHTYCLQCIDGFNVDESSLTCPQCKAKHQLPQTPYPVNLFALSGVEEAKDKTGDNVKEETKLICGFCTTGDVAVGYCIDCGEYLCECCRDVIHKRGKMFSSHKVVSSGEAASLKRVAPMTDNSAPHCTIHTEYRIEVYCRTCVSFVCCKCVLEYPHKEHENLLIRESIEEVTEKMGLLLEAAKSKASEAEACLSLLVKIEELAVGEQHTVRLKMKAFFDELMTILEDIFRDDNKRMSSAKDSITMILSQVASSLSLSACIQDQIGNDRYLLLVNQLLQCLVNIENANLASSIKEAWRINSTSYHFKDTLNTLCNLTAIKEEGRDKENATCRAATRFVPFSEVIRTDAVFDQPFARLSLEWSVKCTNHPDSSPLVKGIADNKITIEFRPKHEGKYTFHLSPVGTLFIVKFDVNIVGQGQCQVLKATKRSNEPNSPRISKKLRIG